MPQAELPRLTDGGAISPPHCVLILIYPGFKPLEAVGPLSVFSYANTLLGRMAYDVRMVSLAAGETGGDIPADGPMSLRAEAFPSDTPLDDATVIVTGAAHIEAALDENPDLVAWLRARGRDAGRLAALCSGSFFLAEAGLLDGLRVTTHWRVADRLARRYGALTVDQDAIFIHEDRIWTSAGVTAAIDISLAFIEADYGRELAVSIARDMVVYLKRPGGQAQFSHALQHQSVEHGVIAEIRRFILEHLDEDFTLAGLAERARMSERNFSRLFHRETGRTPFVFLNAARLERARTLLEETRHSVKQIALSCGYGTDQELRRMFRQHFGISPVAYRARFATSRRALPQTESGGTGRKAP